MLAFWLFLDPPAVAAGAWLGFDPWRGRCCLRCRCCSSFAPLYGVSYLRIRSERPNRVFVAALLAVLGLLSAGHQARHLGLLWITTEAVTLAAVPLLHFNGTPRAFEATWKYLLVGGTGIALSLLGSFCLGYASLHGGGEGDLTFVALMRRARVCRALGVTAWVLLLVGYGTKMGLAPMHTWKPEAYGEAPGIVGAILAGGVTTVAFTAILRVRAVVGAAGEGRHRRPHVAGHWIVFHAGGGVVSPGDARLQTDARVFQRRAHGHPSHRRGAGPRGRVGRVISCLEQQPDQRRAVSERGQYPPGSRITPRWMTCAAWPSLTPRSAAIFVAGMFAVTACPPFGPFFSELQVVRAALETGHGRRRRHVSGLPLLAFFGLTRVVFGIVDGRPRARQGSG